LKEPKRLGISTVIDIDVQPKRLMLAELDTIRQTQSEYMEYVHGRSISGWNSNIKIQLDIYAHEQDQDYTNGPVSPFKWR
jgi:hypothetical protein